MTILIVSCATVDVEPARTVPEIEPQKNTMASVVVLFKSCSIYLYAVVVTSPYDVYIIPLDDRDDNYIINLKSLVPSANLVEVHLAECT